MSSKAVLVTLFEQGDIPSGSNFADFINSCCNLIDTTEQQMAGALSTTELITPVVSAATGNFTTEVKTARVSATTGRFTSGLEIQSNMSVARLYVSTSVHTSAIDMRGGRITNVSAVIGNSGIVSAAGTAQGTAAILPYIVNRGKGVADGTTTGFAPPANRAGFVQYLFNEGVSANLWPPTGGTINGLAANAAFPLAASAMVTIVHLTASAMAVK